MTVLSPMTDTMPELSLVIPTYNERMNLESTLCDVVSALVNRPYEIIVVDDDSPDETWALAQSLTAAMPRLRVIRRTAVARDLSQSVIEGFRAARGRIIGSMNVDGSHDARALVELWDAVRTGADVAIGSRYTPEGRLESWPLHRRWLSLVATTVVRLVTGVRARDPLSGFYLLTTQVYETASPLLRPRGFKLLLQLLAYGRPSRVAEIPIRFRDRRSGRSKMSWKIAWLALLTVLEIRTRERRHRASVERTVP